MNTVLFDLDGTLLPMDQDVYVRNYIRLLTSHFAALGHDADLFSKGLLQATLAAMGNESEMTNEEMFWSVFSSIAGPGVRENQEELFHFYAEKHPTLCTAVTQGRHSRLPVEVLKSKGYRVALATNPVFPRMATYQRMSWAGFVPEDFEYVTTFENSCRSKPNAAYYAELLDKLGCQPEDCLMVGNDTRDDMKAARKAGLAVWLMTDFLIDGKGIRAQYPQGTFAEFVKYVRELPEAKK